MTDIFLKERYCQNLLLYFAQFHQSFSGDNFAESNVESATILCPRQSLLPFPRHLDKRHVFTSKLNM